MKKFYVYVYLDPRKKGNFNYNEISFEYEPFYIGKGSGYRYLHHLYDKEKNPIKINKIKKIITEGYEPIIKKLFVNLSEQEALDKEVALIEKIGKIIDNKGPLTNILNGGGFEFSDEVKEKMKLKNRPKMTEETKNKIRKNHQTDEYRKKMSDKMKSIVNITDEIKEKISKTLISKKIKRSEETKKKIGDKNRDKKHSKTSRENMRLSHIGISIPKFEYVFTSPDNKHFKFIGEKDMIEFVKNRNMSFKLILLFMNKEKISIKRHTIKTINTENWIVKKIKI